MDGVLRSSMGGQSFVTESLLRNDRGPPRRGHRDDRPGVVHRL